MNTLEYQAAAENEKTKAIGMDVKKCSCYIVLSEKRLNQCEQNDSSLNKTDMHNKLLTLITSMGVEKYEKVDEFYFNFYNYIWLKVDLPIH